MNPYYSDSHVALYHGDCLDVLRELEDGSVDAVVCDPPYGLGFMGSQWDQPDQYASKRKGPKRRPITAGAVGVDHKTTTDRSASMVAGDYDLTLTGMQTFQLWCSEWARECLRVLKPGGHLTAFGGTRTFHRLAAGIEDAGFEIRDGKAWIYGQGFPKSLNVGDGRGTALKPAWEPIVLARKPLSGTVAATVLEHGTGALNIDGCRVEAAVGDSWNAGPGGSGFTPESYERGLGRVAPTSGRWPTNVTLTHSPDCGEECTEDCPVAEMDRQSGVTTSQGGSRGAGGQHGALSPIGAQPDFKPGLGDTGGASRFFPVFRYEPKADASERPKVDGIAHPTVKPVALMRWLVRLVTPPGGTVLDPFAGSGTTLQAARAEGLDCIGVEREADYLPLIRERLERVGSPVNADEGGWPGPKKDTGQVSVFDLLGGDAA